MKNGIVFDDYGDYDAALAEYLEHIALTWTAKCPEDEDPWEWFNVILKLALWIVPGHDQDHYLNAVDALRPRVPITYLDECLDGDDELNNLRDYANGTVEPRRNDYYYVWDFAVEALRFLCTPLPGSNEPPVAVLAKWSQS